MTPVTTTNLTSLQPNLTSSCQNMKMSGSNSETETSAIASRVRGMNLGERPRIAKKSTSVDHLKMTKRQAALASKDKSKQDLARMLSADGSADEELTSTGRVDRRRGKKGPVKRLPGAVYDSVGIHISGADVCDCLQDECSGCHFKCPSCGSQKCGAECRVNRKYIYDQVEFHGYEFTIKNPLLK